jgi:hypothetical protein
MFDTNLSSIAHAITHFIGNKLKDEDLRLSTEESVFDEPTRAIIWKYVVSAFKAPEFYRFTHTAELDLNNVYTIARDIFSNQQVFVKRSQDLAKLLETHSQHPQVKSGELFIMYFKRLSFGGVSGDAIGIFKSEKKEPFLFTEEQDAIIDIHSFQGISPSKVDKACVIFNVDEEDGYQVLSVDNLNKGEETKFWFEDFLNIKQRSTEYTKTSNIINITKDFILNDLNSDELMEKSEKIDLLNKSKDFFSENESFDQEEFAVQVFEDKGVADRFKAYTAEKDRDGFNYEEGFEISQDAFKKKQRVFKSVLKLDKNFSVYIHGNRDMIEKGTDDTGRKYYKLYFDEEA